MGILNPRGIIAIGIDLALSWRRAWEVTIFRQLIQVMHEK